MPDPIIIGSFGKSFGIRGWIKVNSFVTPQNKILQLKPWLIARNNVWEEVLLEDQKEQSGSIIVKLPCYDTPEVVSNLTNCKIGVWRYKLPDLSKDEYYWVDLIGLKVINTKGIEFGTVKDLMATGANDVLVVEGRERILIPYISNVIQKVNLEEHLIVVDWEQGFQ